VGNPRFGPAGTPPRFEDPIFKLPKFLHNEGLGALEYQATRWGTKPQMPMEHANRLGLEARQWDVRLSLHASYFMNLCGERDIVEASKRRFVACVEAAHWMKASDVIFHPGFYGNRSPDEALKLCVKSVSEVVVAMKTLGFTGIHLRPETMGKTSQLGSLDEVITLSQEVELIYPAVDWAHVHARDKGRFRRKGDYVKVLNTIEDRLGAEALKDLHCHYTRVEFSGKGEVRHHTLEEKSFGPCFQPLAELVFELGLSPILICESPLLDLDAVEMRQIYLNLTREKH